MMHACNTCIQCSTQCGTQCGTQETHVDSVVALRKRRITLIVLGFSFRTYVSLVRCLPRLAYSVHRAPRGVCSSSVPNSAMDTLVRGIPPSSFIIPIPTPVSRTQKDTFVANILRNRLLMSRCKNSLCCSDKICPVCLQGYEKEDSLHLYCGHAFHHTCIQRWLIHSDKLTCPICRDSLLDRVLEMGQITAK